MWDILAWIIVGGVAGWATNVLIEGSDMGVIMDIIIGIVGAVLGGALLTFILPDSFAFTGFNLISLLIAVVGAAVLLLIARAVTGVHSRAI